MSTSDESSIAYRMGLATGESIKSGDRATAERLLELFNKRDEVWAKLYLLGWKCDPTGRWFKPLDKGQVTGVNWNWVTAACAEEIVSPEDASILMKIMDIPA